MTAEIPQSLAQRFVTYAQNFEDVMLWRALQQVERGFYIDVGAQSPETDSVTKAFSLRGWRGINIEPHPTYHEQLLKLRPRDLNLGVALGEQSGSLTMNLVGDSGLSTANEAFAGQHAAAGYAVHRHEVRMLTLAEVWRTHVPDGQAVHFLKVDVEGFERSVIAGNDWKFYRPWIVIVEATLPNSQVESYEDWEPILQDADYKFVYADGLNRFYVAGEHTELCSVFKYPPNVFDGLSTSLEQGLREALDSAQNVIEQSNAQRANLLEQLDLLTRDVRESHRRIEVFEAALIQAREREAALQEHLTNETTALRHEIAHRDESLANLKQRAEAAERAHEAIVQSPWWRITGPARTLMAAVPATARRQLRRVGKLGWWIMTPLRIPARLRFLRERRQPMADQGTQVSTFEPAELNLYPDRFPDRPVEPPLGSLSLPVTNRAAAARWCMCLLRSHPEVRRRFPRALTVPQADGFLEWIAKDGGQSYGLPEASRQLVAAVLLEDFGARARRYYLDRADVRALHPYGLDADGVAALYRWFAEFGCSEGQLSADEVLWLAIQVYESTFQEETVRK